MTTLDDLENRLNLATDCASLFGNDASAFLKRVKVICHPDRYPGDPATIARADALRSRALELVDRWVKAATSIQSPKRSYELVSLLAIGDVSDVHLARSGGKDYVVKIARVSEGARLLNVEQETITEILTKAGKTHYDHFIPTLCESFAVKDAITKRVNVFVRESGFYMLEEVHACHPSLDGRHLAWIFKRLLTAIGVAHRCGFVHGAVCPAHIQIHAENHGLQLLGWGHSVKLGQKITSGSAKYLSWYPIEVKQKRAATTSTDIYLAAKCMVYLSGGDPASQQVPATVPAEMARFLKSCLIEGPGMRPDDAWGLLDAFDEMLRGLYGPPKYHELTMS